MQNGIIFFPDSTNIGDDIQTYAASLLVNDPEYCNRERLDEISTKTRLLCNGWFMEEAGHWPPSDKVHPLFLSFHISSKIKSLMTTPEAIAYYKRFEPIGCRDYHTLNLLKEHDVKAYFSGCLTLTLPRFEGLRGNDIYFVDVLRTNYSDDYRQSVVKNIIPDEYKNRIKFISHFSNDLKDLDPDNRMLQAKSLLEKYAKAKLVFTSLIHCALPCIALGTPVIFVDFGFNNDEAKRDRFEGILDLFHIESGLSAPLMERNLIGKLGRGLRLYHLSKHKIKELPIKLFQHNEVTTKHLNLAESMKTEINNFFNK